MRLIAQDDGWRLGDKLWERIEPLSCRLARRIRWVITVRACRIVMR
jgi:hypothetical protein